MRETLLNEVHKVDFDKPRNVRECTVSSAEFSNAVPYRYMHVKQNDKIEAMENDLEALEKYITANGHTVVSPDQITTSEPVTVVGRIFCESEGKLNDKTIILQGSRKFKKARILLNVQDLQSYAFFPGQLVALTGTNINGNLFHVHQVLSTDKLALKKDSVECLTSLYYTSTQEKLGPLRILIACGPFTASDLTYDALTKLFVHVDALSPDVLVLCGPFIDALHPQVLEPEKFQGESFDDLFSKLLGTIATRCKSARVLIVPSLRDVVHDNIYPQWPIQEKFKNIEFLSNPATITINEVVIGINNTDFLMHLSAEECARAEVGVDRMSRLVTYMIDQKTYYPLYPPGAVNLEVLQSQYLRMNVLPDILVLPSDLRHFVRVIDKAVCVNPGKVAKGEAGTFVVCEIVPPSLKSLSKMDPQAQIPHQIHARARLDLFRLS